MADGGQRLRGMNRPVIPHIWTPRPIWTPQRRFNLPRYRRGIFAFSPAACCPCPCQGCVTCSDVPPPQELDVTIAGVQAPCDALNGTYRLELLFTGTPPNCGCIWFISGLSLLGSACVSGIQGFFSATPAQGFYIVAHELDGRTVMRWFRSFGSPPHDCHAVLNGITCVANLVTFCGPNPPGPHCGSLAPPPFPDQSGSTAAVAVV